jgi:hypothetical protein
MDQQETVSKFDRIRGGLHNVAIFTKPSTIQNVQSITGRAETFIVETARFEDQGDTIFVQCVDENEKVIRLALPPKVADCIAYQRASLTTRRRSAAGKRRAAADKEAGIQPGFMRGKKSPRKRKQ